MARILIKRSPGDTAPAALGQGELAITSGAGHSTNAGERLFAGTGPIDANTGLAENVSVIGGKYFADLLDHTPGVVTAESGLIVDADSKLDVLKVDEITIDGDTISSTGNLNLLSSDDGDANTSAQITLNGTVFTQGGVQQTSTLSGDTATFANVTISNNAVTHTGTTKLDIFTASNIVDFGDVTVKGVLNPTANTDASNKGYVDNLVATTTYTLGDGSEATDSSVFSGTFVFKGANQTAAGAAYANSVDIATAVTDNTMTFQLTETGVTANAYGSATAIPVLTVDSRGRITGVTTQAISSNFTLSDGTNTDVFNNGETLTFTGDTGLTTTVSNNEVTIDLDDTAVTPNTYGSALAIPTITIDQQGRITNATTAAISTSFTISDGTGTDLVNNGETLTFEGGTGVTSTVSDNKVSLAIGQDVATTADVQFNDVTVDGNLYSNDITASTVTIYGDLTVVGNTTTVNTEEINLADNTIQLNSNQDPGTAPTQDAGIEVNRGSASNVSFVWDETNDQWTTNGQKLEAIIDGGDGF